MCEYSESPDSQSAIIIILNPKWIIFFAVLPLYPRNFSWLNSIMTPSCRNMSIVAYLLSDLILNGHPGGGDDGGKLWKLLTVSLIRCQVQEHWPWLQRETRQLRHWLAAHAAAGCSVLPPHTPESLLFCKGQAQINSHHLLAVMFVCV